MENEKKLLENAHDRLLKIIECEDNPKKDKFSHLGKGMNELSKKFKKEIEKSKQPSSKYARYKYGSVVIVDFGLNLGDEICNKHFAIVLTNKDSPYNSLLTVLPLSSKNKPGRLSLGNELLVNLFQKIKVHLDSMDNEIKKASKILNLNSENLKFIISKYLPEKDISVPVTEEEAKIIMSQVNAEEINIIQETFESVTKTFPVKSDEIEKNLKKLKEILDIYINKNNITYAIIDQIQTISKFKILKPINEFDPISSLLIDSKTMLKVENEIVNRLFSKAKKIVDNQKKE